MREEKGVIESLHSSHSGGDRPMHHEVVVHVGITRRQGGRVYLPSNHGNPIGSFKNIGLEIPVTTNDKRALETLDQDGGVLQDE